MAAGIAAGVSREDTNVINDCCQLRFCLCLGWMETRALLPRVVPAPRCLMDITYLYLHLEGGGRHNCFAGIYQIGQKEAVPINRKHHRALLGCPGSPSRNPRDVWRLPCSLITVTPFLFNTKCFLLRPAEEGRKPHRVPRDRAVLVWCFRGSSSLAQVQLPFQCSLPSWRGASWRVCCFLNVLGDVVEM